MGDEKLRGRPISGGVRPRRSIRLHDAEYDLLKQAAAVRRVKLSEWIRATLLDAATRELTRR